MTLSKLAESAFPDEIRRERAAIGEAVAVVKASDVERLEDAMEQIDGNVYRGWRRFFLRLIREQAAVSDDMRTAWLRSWIMSGDHIRQETNDDLLLASALRVLLPR